MCQFHKGKEIARVILQQLGGNRFLVMTGANNLLHDANGLRFRIPRARDGINYVHVTLTPEDTYTVEFSKLYRRSGFLGMATQRADVIHRLEHVYAEDLARLFSEATGLAVRL